MRESLVPEKLEPSGAIVGRLLILKRSQRPSHISLDLLGDFLDPIEVLAKLRQIVGPLLWPYGLAIIDLGLVQVLIQLALELGDAREQFEYFRQTQTIFPQAPSMGCVRTRGERSRTHTLLVNRSTIWSAA